MATPSSFDIAGLQPISQLHTLRAGNAGSDDPPGSGGQNPDELPDPQAAQVTESSAAEAAANTANS